MDKLNEIDVTGVEPMAQVLFDAEETATCAPTYQSRRWAMRLALANAPQPGAGYFKVPKVIETLERRC